MLFSRHTKRREFITLLGGSVALPLAARGQQGDRLRRVGVLIAYAEDDPDARARVSALVQALRGVGWVDGQNLQITYGYASSDGTRLKEAARALIASAPDVIVVQSNPAVVALREVDRNISGVFVQVGDPVGSGFVDRLSRPGGNLTGFSTSDADMGGKWLELLKDIAPWIRQVAVVHHPDIRATWPIYPPRKRPRRYTTWFSISSPGVRGRKSNAR
jgi:putative tryptophan/tyrosine transport system substrate-binding protein